MRIAGFILAILGALTAGFLGFIWINDYNEGIDLVNPGGNEEYIRQMIGIGRAGYLLIAGTVVGLIGGIMTFMGKGRKWIGPLMIGAALAPAIFVPPALMFTSILLIAGIICTIVGVTAAPLSTVQR